MEKQSATSNLISVFAICFFLWLISILGLITMKQIYFVPFLTASIYFISVLFWKTHHAAFPYYFHMTLLYLLMNNGLGTHSSIKTISMIFLILVFVFSVFSIYHSVKAGYPFTSIIDGISNISKRYQSLYKEHPDILLQTFMHAVILFLIACISLIAYRHRGYWLLVSGLAVLIGEEYDKIITRGMKRMIGAMIGFLVAALLVRLHASRFVLIAVVFLTYVGVFRCMPEKYIIGSACIGLQAALGNALLQNAFGYEIFIQRMVWTILGSILTCFLCYLFDK